MTQVELALKEKSGVENKFGVNLCTDLFGAGKGVKLRVPFGEESQKAAERLFAGAFAYYRNYAAHNGSNIDKRVCLRVMVLASELLDLIGASDLSFADVGGVAGLIKADVFSGRESLRNLLHLLEGYTILDDIVDGFFETLALRGFCETQVHAVMAYGSPIFKAVRQKRCKALYTALTKSPKSPEYAVGEGSERSNVERSVAGPP